MKASRILIVVGLATLAATTTRLASIQASDEASPNPSLPVAFLCASQGMRLESLVEVRTVQAEFASSLATDGAPIDGWFSYRSEGDAWRAANYMDPARYAGLSAELAYDGLSKATLVYHSASLAGITFEGEPQNLGPILPHPLFELAAWARPLDATTIISPPKLSDLRAMTAAQLAVPASAWQAVEENGLPRLEAYVPGSVLDGQPYLHRLVVAVEEPDQLRAIERVTDGGLVLTRIEFDAWCPVDGWPGGPQMPRLVTAYEYDAEGLPIASIAFTILTLELSPPADPLALEADEDAAEHLWDADQEVFLR